VARPSGSQGREEEKGLSSVAEGYRKAAPYMAASTQLVIAVGVFLALGLWLDRKIGTQVPWFTILGSLFGMAGGFLSFFRTVLKTRKR
jgi:F0F1-type ATP synthase assembly protein I